jgi:hypothetical protein
VPTNHTHFGWLGWNSSPCTAMACHTACGRGCSTNAWKLDWPYFSGCFGTYKATTCSFPASRKAVKVSTCPIIAVKACHNATWFGTGLIGGGSPNGNCSLHTSNCNAGTHPYYGEANRAFMASLGVTTTNSNLYADFSWSSP